MSLMFRTILVAAVAAIVLPAAARAQDSTAKKTDSAATTPKTTDLSVLTGFYEVAPGRGLTITLEKDTLYGAPSSGEKKKLIPQSELTFAVDGTKMTLIFVMGDDGKASDLIMQQGGQTRTLPKTK